MGWHARMMRLGMLIEGRFSEWNSVNLRALRQLSPVIKEDNLKVIDAFESACRGNVVQRLWKLREAGVYRQTVLGNVGLYAAALLRKL